MFCRVIGRCLSQSIYNSTKQVRGIKRWVAPTLHELQRRKVKAGPEPPAPRSDFLEWNYDAEIYAFSKRLGEEFKDDVLRTALTHESHVVKEQLCAEKTGNSVSNTSSNTEMIRRGNEIICDYVNERFETKYPSVVAKGIRDYLMCESMLARVASHVGLKDVVLSGEFPLDVSTLADSFKAIVAAVEESSGLERACLFVKDFLLCQLNGKEVFDVWMPERPYEYFEELRKEKGLQDVIEARLCRESAKNSILANYQVGLYCDRQLLGLGWGETIETAKNTAACDAIRKMYQFSFNKLV